MAGVNNSGPSNQTVILEAEFLDPGPFSQAHGRFLKFRSELTKLKDASAYAGSVLNAEVYVESPNDVEPVVILVRLRMVGASWAEIESLANELCFEAARQSGIWICRDDAPHDDDQTEVYEPGGLQLVSA